MPPTWLEIDLDAIGHNTRQVLALAGVPLMAVVKANAYGLGAVEVGRTALAAGATWLAVARWPEAERLRAAGITAPILVFGPPTPEELPAAISAGVTLSLHSRPYLRQLVAAAEIAGQPARVHLKLDTGFGRLGALPEEAVELARQAVTHGLILDGLYSHLAMADEIPGHPLTAAQLERFIHVLRDLQAAGLEPPWVHLANSAAAFGLPATRFNLVRVGSALVGFKPFYFEPFPANLRRVVTWKARLAACKQLPPGWSVGYGQTYTPTPGEWIGTLPVGYGDGYRRLPGNTVLIGGQRAAVVGRVCNDLCMLRLPRAFPEGEEVVLIGRQGDQEITTDELVDRWHTSQADILSNINPRVPRYYRNS
jgi:alanine racemase